MKVLYVAFKGILNSSKILLDNINVNCQDKLYLNNNFKISETQLENKIRNNDYDLIISFGWCPLDYNYVKIEKAGTAKDGTKLYTNYDIDDLEHSFIKNNYNVLISEDAGDYLCNNIYYHGLKYIKDNNLKCRMIFIHIPKLKNIGNIKRLSSIFNK